VENLAGWNFKSQHPVASIIFCRKFKMKPLDVPGRKLKNDDIMLFFKETLI
jgi:hypothetical protein